MDHKRGDCNMSAQQGRALSRTLKRKRRSDGKMGNAKGLFSSVDYGNE